MIKNIAQRVLGYWVIGCLSFIAIYCLLEWFSFVGYFLVLVISLSFYLACCAIFIPMFMIFDNRRKSKFKALVVDDLAGFINKKHMLSHWESAIVENEKQKYRAIRDKVNEDKRKEALYKLEREKEADLIKKKEKLKMDFDLWYEKNMSNVFYERECDNFNSDDWNKKWRKLRYQAFKKYGNFCCCCGRSPSNDPTVVLHVDHIKPKSIYPNLSLDIKNLQILCADCNFAKSYTDETDWR